MEIIEMINETFNTCYTIEQILKIANDRNLCPRQTIVFLTEIRKVENKEVANKLIKEVKEKQTCSYENCIKCRKNTFGYVDNHKYQPIGNAEDLSSFISGEDT